MGRIGQKLVGIEPVELDRAASDIAHIREVDRLGRAGLRKRSQIRYVYLRHSVPGMIVSCHLTLKLKWAPQCLIHCRSPITLRGMALVVEPLRFLCVNPEVPVDNIKP